MISSEMMDANEKPNVIFKKFGTKKKERAVHDIV